MFCKCSKSIPKTKHKWICDECGRSIKQDNDLVTMQLWARIANEILAWNIDYYSRFPREPVKKITKRQKLARKIKEIRRKLHNTKVVLEGGEFWGSDYD